MSEKMRSKGSVYWTLITTKKARTIGPITSVIQYADMLSRVTRYIRPGFYLLEDNVFYCLPQFII
jgi:hypothetical protein